ncbi:MAG: alpha/beta fold hydrolase [Planctomycetota bacterium]
MEPEALEIPVELAGQGTVSGWLDLPGSDSGRCVLLLAHGAGAGATHPFLQAVARGLAARGLPVLRFQYAHAERALREGRRRPPDRRPALESVHASALAYLRERFPDRRLLLLGKSMGGRMGTYLAAEGADCAGLVLLGYPLHPPGRPDELRSEHFGAIAQPALFLQGTRDALCDLELLTPALELWGGPLSLHVVEGADHGFEVLKQSGRTHEEVLEEICDAIDEWERATFPL